MWTIIIILILCLLVLINLIKVMVYGKGILRPDFKRVDKNFSSITGFGSKWNTTFGKIVYYLLLIFILLSIILILVF